MNATPAALKAAPKKIRVLCVDDSALIRAMMTQIINRQPDMTVVAVATDPLMARELIKQHNPDVLTLDVEMPRMDGLEFLERLMRLRPMPVVMVSSLTSHHSDITLRALELGAVDFVTKPRPDEAGDLRDYSQLIATKIRVAAQARPIRLAGSAVRAAGAPAPVFHAKAVSGVAGGIAGAVVGSVAGAVAGSLAATAPLYFSPQTLIAIGASTGGPEALRHVLQSLPAHLPPILITQHMPAGFTTSFAQRLDRLCALHVVEAQDGQPVLPGHVYFAPGSVAHMELVRGGSGGSAGSPYHIRLNESEPVNRHRPSVDVLLHSVARTAARHAIGVVLTGMGKDGARGLLAMRQAGATTAVQDEASSVVYGMPREAALIGAADTSLALDNVAAWLLEQAGKTARSRSHGASRGTANPPGNPHGNRP